MKWNNIEKSLEISWENGNRAPDIDFHETSVRHWVPHGGKFGNKLRDGYRAPDVGFHETLVRNRVPHCGKTTFRIAEVWK